MSDQDDPVIVVLHVTSPDGTVYGRVDLTADDLAHPRSIGSLVLDELPAEVTP